MVRITIDKATQEKLLSSGEIVELVDESGKLLARVLPQVDDFPNGWEPITPEISEEEYQQRLNSTEPGTPGEEFLARLRADL